MPRRNDRVRTRRIRGEYREQYNAKLSRESVQ